MSGAVSTLIYFLVLCVSCFRSDIPDHNLSDNLDLIQVITDLLSESNLVLLFNNLEFSRTNERGI